MSAPQESSLGSTRRACIRPGHAGQPGEAQRTPGRGSQSPFPTLQPEQEGMAHEDAVLRAVGWTHGGRGHTAHELGTGAGSLTVRQSSAVASGMGEDRRSSHNSIWPGGAADAGLDGSALGGEGRAQLSCGCLRAKSQKACVGLWPRVPRAGGSALCPPPALSARRPGPAGVRECGAVLARPVARP